MEYLDVDHVTDLPVHHGQGGIGSSSDVGAGPGDERRDPLHQGPLLGTGGERKSGFGHGHGTIIVEVEGQRVSALDSPLQALSVSPRHFSGSSCAVRLSIERLMPVSFRTRAGLMRPASRCFRMVSTRR